MDEIKINEVEVTKLDPKATYICQVNMSNAPKDVVMQFLTVLKKRFSDYGITNIVFVPYRDDEIGKLEFIEAKGE